ncbi:hypothetical protein DDE18_01665 [Nocardioides gansuensis]|uniref:Uncharacterized protein n=1 Tax=Nocardioides gansuensis TaxID=2138300 RepID=A0A2T8FF85_9ACTN|nr:hypothetical protein DDE18_01665 [Nocardioides gansuensis]
MLGLACATVLGLGSAARADTWERDDAARDVRWASSNDPMGSDAPPLTGGVRNTVGDIRQVRYTYGHDRLRLVMELRRLVPHDRMPQYELSILRPDGKSHTGYFRYADGELIEGWWGPRSATATECGSRVVERETSRTLLIVVPAECFSVPRRVRVDAIVPHEAPLGTPDPGSRIFWDGANRDGDEFARRHVWSPWLERG